MVDKDVIWAECPDCLRSTRATIHMAVERLNERASAERTDTYRLLECRGCATIYYQHQIEKTVYGPDGTGEDHESVVYYPKRSKREMPSWCVELLMFGDMTLYELLESLYSAFSAGLNVLTAIGVRTAFDRATEVLGINAGLPFNEKLDELLSNGHVGRNEHEILTVLTDAGSAAAHRGWKPTDAETEVMISVLESFVFRNCVNVADVKRLASKVPPKPPRVPGSAAKRAKPGGP